MTIARNRQNKTVFLWLGLLLAFFSITFFFFPFDLPLQAAEKEYDLIVVGSDPEGVAAAVSGAKNGLHTLLLDFEREKVGGLYTLGWLNMLDLNYVSASSEMIVNMGIFGDLYRRLGYRLSFDISDMEQILLDLLQESGVQLQIGLEKEYAPVWGEDGRIAGIKVNQNGQENVYYGHYFIDASQNADFAFMCGVGFYDGLEELGLLGEKAAATLVFQLSGVDWDVMQNVLVHDGNTESHANATAAWGFTQMNQCELSDPDLHVRGLNIGRQKDGTVLVNALQIFHVNPYDEIALQEARVRVKKALTEEVLPYMQEQLPGFQNAELVALAPEFYIRQSRHMQSVQRLRAEDIFTGYFPKGYVALGSYPVDLQARKKGMFGSSLYGTNPYGIPLGVVVPKGEIENLMVVGKCAGFDAIAFGSARTVPVGMALGEAAGVAIKIAHDNGNLPLPSICFDGDLLNAMQKQLRKQGVYLREFPASGEDIRHSWAYNEIAYLRDKAMLSAGYQSRYDLKNTATREALNNILYQVDSNSPLQIPYIPLELLASGESINQEKLLAIVSYWENQEIDSFSDLLAMGILTPKVYERLKIVDQYNNEGFYAFLSCYIRYKEVQA